ncbi:unnamed protein product, partial [Prorocentrum cordatum]
MYKCVLFRRQHDQAWQHIFWGGRLVATLLALPAFCLGLYGAAGFSAQLRHGGCAGAAEALALALVVALLLLGLAWCWLVEDCGCFADLAGCLESVGLGCRCLGPARGARLLLPLPGGAEGARQRAPQPEVLGRARLVRGRAAARPRPRHLYAPSQIQVLRAGRVVYCSNSRKAVRRWIRRNLSDSVGGPR